MNAIGSVIISVPFPIYGRFPPSWSYAESEDTYGDATLNAEFIKEELHLSRSFIRSLSGPKNSYLPSNRHLFNGEVFFHTLEDIRSLVEGGNVEEANHLLSLIHVGISDKIDNWRRVLAKPIIKAKKPATGKNIKTNIAWLQNESGKYKGKWVALKDGKLLGSHKSRIELHQTIIKTHNLSEIMFFKVPEE